MSDKMSSTHSSSQHDLSFPHIANRQNADYKNQAIFNLEEFLDQIHFYDLTFVDTPEEINKELRNVDILEMLNAVRDVQSQLSALKLENRVIIDFLEKNDSKLLIGLGKRRTLSAKRNLPFSDSGMAAAGSSFGDRSIMPAARRSELSSIKSVASSYDKRKDLVDYQLTANVRAEMAHKASQDVERRIKLIEKKSMDTISKLQSRVEELKTTWTEIQYTAESFDLCFYHNQEDIAFLKNAPEVKIEQKLNEFLKHWFQNGHRLLRTMRLNEATLQNNCQQFHRSLISMADLKGISSPVDFERLKIKLKSLRVMFDEKQSNLSCLKRTKANVCLSMSEEKLYLGQMEENSRQLSRKVTEIFKIIHRLVTEADSIEEENQKHSNRLKELKIKLERFEAPSIDKFIEKKKRCLVLEKEEKMLERKLRLIHMRLQHLLQKNKPLFSDDFFAQDKPIGCIENVPGYGSDDGREFVTSSISIDEH